MYFVLGEIKLIIRFSSFFCSKMTRPPGFYFLFFIFLNSREIHKNGIPTLIHPFVLPWVLTKKEEGAKLFGISDEKSSICCAQEERSVEDISEGER
jgi:hypothetical protein